MLFEFFTVLLMKKLLFKIFFQNKYYEQHQRCTCSPLCVDAACAHAYLRPWDRNGLFSSVSKAFAWFH